MYAFFLTHLAISVLNFNVLNHLNELAIVVSYMLMCDVLLLFLSLTNFQKDFKTSLHMSKFLEPQNFSNGLANFLKFLKMMFTSVVIIKKGENVSSQDCFDDD